MLKYWIEQAHASWPVIGPAAGLLLAYGAMGALYRYFSFIGLYIYISLIVLITPIQVLKVVQFGFLPYPVAMGTALFSTLFLATDLLTENHGVPIARRGTILGFLAQALFVSLIFLTLLPKPALGYESIQQALEMIFLPHPSLFVAGLLAFLVGQWYDIKIYQWLKEKTNGRLLWLRTGISYAIATFLDNTLFSILAWKVFAVYSIEWNVLFKTYILSTYILRIGFGCIHIALIYPFRRLKPKADLIGLQPSL